MNVNGRISHATCFSTKQPLILTTCRWSWIWSGSFQSDWLSKLNLFILHPSFPYNHVDYRGKWIASSEFVALVLLEWSLIPYLPVWEASPPMRRSESGCCANIMSLLMFKVSCLGCLSKHRLWRQVGTLVDELPHHFSLTNPCGLDRTLSAFSPALLVKWSRMRLSISVCKQINAWAREVDVDGTMRHEVPFLDFMATPVTLFTGSLGCSGFGERKAPCWVASFCSHWGTREVNAQFAFFRDRDGK